MSGFTPGPWTITPHAKFGDTQMYWVNKETSVGTQVKADVQLIAAAPELYEALDAFIAEADAGHVSVETDKVARAVLAKARGESC